jgi:hypothetical protein
MKKTIIAVAVLCSFAVSTISFAGELSVTGAAKATYAIVSSDGTNTKSSGGKGLGIANEFSLGASGELDNGWTWNYAQDIDGATVQDDAKMTVTTGMGTVGVFVSEGGISSKYAFSTAAYGPGSDYGISGGSGSHSAGALGKGFHYGDDIGTYNNVQYHLPAGLLPYEGTFKIAHAPSGGKNAAASSNASGSTQGATDGRKATQIQTTFTPIDGFKLSASYFEKDTEGSDLNSKVQEYQAGGLGGKYTSGPFSVGISKFLIAPMLAVQTRGTEYVRDFENTSASLGFVANDNLSLSLMVEKSEQNGKTNGGTGVTRTDRETKITSAQGAYTMGGMTISLAHKEIDNAAYTDNLSLAETVVAVVMAF